MSIVVDGLNVRLAQFDGGCSTGNISSMFLDQMLIIRVSAVNDGVDNPREPLGPSDIIHFVRVLVWCLVYRCTPCVFFDKKMRKLCQYRSYEFSYTRWTYVLKRMSSPGSIALLQQRSVMSWNSPFTEDEGIRDIEKVMGETVSKLCFVPDISVLKNRQRQIPLIVEAC